MNYIIVGGRLKYAGATIPGRCLSLDDKSDFAGDFVT
jgi:hypothetical protein